MHRAPHLAASALLALAAASGCKYPYTGDVEDAGNSTLPLSVQAIFQTLKPVTLTSTSERKLAFELLDADGNGTLDATEFPAITARRGSPDTNHDGKVDWNEFDADDNL